VGGLPSYVLDSDLVIEGAAEVTDATDEEEEYWRDHRDLDQGLASM
jgi:hypothetical protein